MRQNINIQQIKINNRCIGYNNPCFIVAEIGINHNGDLELAKKCIDAAVEAGADGVKFQNYRTKDFISDPSITYEYTSQGKKVVESQYDMFKRYELSYAQLKELSDYSNRKNTIFFSTPTSKKGLQELVEIGVPLIKNGSDYLTHLPLIRAMAGSGLPTIISTGMATFTEIEDAVRAFSEAGGKGLILLHCTSSYPAPVEEINLRKIPGLSINFACPVGFSDHTSGTTAAIAAVALGSCFIEKHFTLNNNLPGPDHNFSADPTEFSELVKAIRIVEKSLGTSEIGPTPSEMNGRKNFRLSCVAARDLPEGHNINQADIAFRRPGSGLSPKNCKQLLGRQLSRPVTNGYVFNEDDLI